MTTPMEKERTSFSVILGVVIMANQSVLRMAVRVLFQFGSLASAIADFHVMPPVASHFFKKQAQV